MPGQTRDRYLAEISSYISLDGVRMTVAEAAAAHGLAKNTLKRRLARGWPVERAVQPVRQREARS